MIPLNSPSTFLRPTSLRGLRLPYNQQARPPNRRQDSSPPLFAPFLPPKRRALRNGLNSPTTPPASAVPPSIPATMLGGLMLTIATVALLHDDVWRYVKHIPNGVVRLGFQ